ncbi:MAG: O-antigen ligase family protein [bacterium]
MSYFILGYFAIRLFSFLCAPGHFFNTLISVLILAGVAYFLLKKDFRGWYIIAGEMILGGIGGFFNIEEISLRTALLVCSISIFIIQKIRAGQIKQAIQEDKFVCYFFLAIYSIVAISTVRGYLFGNDLKLIISDAIPYLFLLYYFPLKELWLVDKFKKLILNLVTATVIGNLVFVLFTFIIYSAGLAELQNTYYKWFRDVAGGKITDLKTGFFRIVLNEHLLLVPLLLYYLHKVINKHGRKLLSVLLLIILSVNLTRIYILALLFGLIIMFAWKNWRRWLVVSLASGLIFISSFTSIHLVSSRGQDLGWEVFGLRVQSIAKPEIEPSALSRMLLLPKIGEKIVDKPILGHGLGDAVTVYSPVVEKEITTPHFDWGYLEIWVEMGMIGILIWLGFLVLVLIKTKNIPILVSLLVINLTSPAFFHVMGIVLLIILLNNKKPYA